MPPHSKEIEKVVVHPLVLLSVVDHYNRVAKDTSKRVAGILLGSLSKGTLDVTNSFAGTSQREGHFVLTPAPAPPFLFSSFPKS